MSEKWSFGAPLSSTSPRPYAPINPLRPPSGQFGNFIHGGSASIGTPIPECIRDYIRFCSSVLVSVSYRFVCFRLFLLRPSLLSFLFVFVRLRPRLSGGGGGGVYQIRDSDTVANA